MRWQIRPFLQALAAAAILASAISAPARDDGLHFRTDDETFLAFKYGTERWTICPHGDCRQIMGWLPDGTVFMWTRDDGRYAQSPLKSWFDQLHSAKGNCCSFNDGVRIDDADWRIEGSQYQVRIAGTWIVVPDEALVTVPNLAGHAIVWPFSLDDGPIEIRCFMPGTLG